MFRATSRLAAAVPPGVVKTAVTRANGVQNKVIPGLVVVGAGKLQPVSGVVAYVRSQLRYESDAMNRMFAKPNSQKQRALSDIEGVPRKTFYNILNW
ncbi:hypothetical protein VTJ49DRAFT_5416 [Mycothermus thermophilus]|uniref:Uncharacterized protein n=1 Tax=Humicola insolens TaxID=85995 RepID=A0ABR3V491_HUMIN